MGTAAAKRFDKVLRIFQGKMIQAMLPPEVENLHRVVHMLETLKHSLLHELGGTEGESSLSMTPTPQLVNDCDRYFAGVRQLESDAAYYQELNSPKKAQSPDASKPAGRAAQLEPLSLGGPRGPALSARGF